MRNCKVQCKWNQLQSKVGSVMWIVFVRSCNYGLRTQYWLDGGLSYLPYFRFSAVCYNCIFYSCKRHKTWLLKNNTDQNQKPRLLLLSCSLILAGQTTKRLQLQQSISYIINWSSKNAFEASCRIEVELFAVVFHAILGSANWSSFLVFCLLNIHWNG